MSAAANDRLARSAPARLLIKPLLKRVRGRGQRVVAVPQTADNMRNHLAGHKPAVPSSDPEIRALQERVAKIDWYHSIDLGNGIVTPGKVDHRAQLPLYHLPKSLKGMRCLDVASMDGFWAFEMERRGADEVVAIDVARRIDVDLPYGVRDELIRAGKDAPASGGFGLAHEVLGSKVKKHSVSVYDLSPEVLGEFDFVFLSDLLLHLRDPQLALERVRSVCRGTVHVADVCDPDLERFGDLCLAEYPLWVSGKYFYWWRMNVNTIKRMLQVAGFEVVEEISRLRLNLIQAIDRDVPSKVVLRGTIAGAKSMPASSDSATVEVGEANGASGASSRDSLNRIRRERWLALGPLEIGMSVPIATDRRVAGSAVVKRAIKPVLDRAHGANGSPQATIPSQAAPVLPARRPEPSDVDAGSRLLRDRVAQIGWYHSIDLGHGVITPGRVDYRADIARYQLPASLAGKRCLDVATSDGFWAFEMEKRGAADVVAVDVARLSEFDMPTQARQEMLRNGADMMTGDGFRLAHGELGSRVLRKTVSVYELSPESLGSFDFIFVGDLLLDVRDPQLALERIRSVCRGTMQLVDTYHAGLEPFGEACLAEYPLAVHGERAWWFLGRNAIKRMVQMAGFQTVEELSCLSTRLRSASSGRVTTARKVVLRAIVVASPHTEVREAELSAAR
jgi:tRNA (mo5U34)-methyltransferase